MKFIFFVLVVLFSGCALNDERVQTQFLTNTCIKPLKGYHYLTCSNIVFSVDHQLFTIPPQFETDLASIPKMAWPIIAPAHSSLMRPAIVHDWFYRKTCDFNRYQTDIIFYSMLRNEGFSRPRALLMYYAVRLFGGNYYNEDYCDDERKELDKAPRRIQAIPLFGYNE